MNERLTTSDLADVLAVQTGMDKKHADDFINALSSYISQRIEKNKSVRLLGLGTFKVVLVRERESVHIQTGERFVIPAHHKLSFIPDKDFKEHINRPFAFFEPIETVEEEHKPKKVSFSINNVVDSDASDQEESVIDEVADLGEEQNNTQDLNTEKEDDFEAPAAIAGSQTDKEYFSNEEYASVSIEVNDEIDFSEEIKEYNLSEDEVAAEFAETVSIDYNYDTDEVLETVETVYINNTDEIIKTDETDNIDVTDDNDEIIETDKTDDIDYSDITALSDNSAKTDDRGGRAENVEPVIRPKAPEMKKKTVPSWFLYLVVPLIAFLGSFLAVYLFLYYNTDKSSVNNQPLNVITYEPDATGDTFLQDGSIAIQDSGKTEITTTTDGFSFPESSENSEQGEEDESVIASTQTATSDKAAKDWLTPLPETTNTQTKRANRPNEEIERKNRDLPRTTTSGTTQAGAAKTTAAGANAAQPEAKEKIIPKSVRLTAGSSLRQIAEEYYGDRVFWVYIYEYNKDKIKNYNNIPVGTEVKLPLPRTYGINAGNKSSIQKAEQKQTELYRSNPGK